jgi:DNA-binding HxlR family transcriptional regulator
MAAEVFCTKWTAVLMRELLSGSTRFNDLRRGLPRVSPTLLSARLKDLQAAGVVMVVAGPGGQNEYHLTEAGRDLRGLVMGLGFWGQKWIESRLSLRNLDSSLLMWDMRRNLNPAPMPARRCTIQFLYPELPHSQQSWWLVVEKGEADLCSIDPGFEIDLLVHGSLRAMTAVWMGLATVEDEVAAGKLRVDGDPELARTIQQWLGLSPFARGERRAS